MMPSASSKNSFGCSCHALKSRLVEEALQALDIFFLKTAAPSG